MSTGDDKPARRTPLFDSLHESRYSRQEMIREMNKETGRELIVYISPIQPIEVSDILGFSDLLHNTKDSPVDLLIQSPGGDIDAAEKIVNLCRSRSSAFRVIVAESAKSAATLIALASDEIIMGDTSELGPIDPQITITTPQGQTIKRPAQSFLDGLKTIKEQADEDGELSPVYYPLLSNLDPALLDYCEKSIRRAQQFAQKWLEKSQLKNDPTKAADIAKSLADNQQWLSHGAVIDADEAKALGLNVKHLEHDDPLWQQIWRLYCRYFTDAQAEGYEKIFESSESSLGSSS